MPVCACEYSEAVAALGHKANGGPGESQQLLDDIRMRLEPCIAVADEIDRYAFQLPAPTVGFARRPCPSHGQSAHLGFAAKTGVRKLAVCRLPQM